MLKGNRKPDFALGLILGALCVVIIVSILLSSPAQEVFSNSDNYIQSGSSNSPRNYNWDKPVWGPWHGLWFERSDTVAQWLMMVFTIAATGVLILTLRSANKTNAAALKASGAALDANRIMIESNRPWVRHDFKLLGFYQDEKGFFLKFDAFCENIGEAPALNVCCDFMLVNAFEPSREVKEISVRLNGIREGLKNKASEKDQSSLRTSIFPSDTYQPGVKTHVGFPKEGKSGVIFNVTLFAAYQMHGSDKIFESIQSFQVARTDRFGNFYSIVNLPQDNPSTDAAYMKNIVVRKFGFSHMT